MLDKRLRYFMWHDDTVAGMMITQLNYTSGLSSFLPAALRAAQICLYLVYSEADFEVFRPAGATHCTDGGEIWHGGTCQNKPIETKFGT